MIPAFIIDFTLARDTLLPASATEHLLFLRLALSEFMT